MYYYFVDPKTVPYPDGSIIVMPETYILAPTPSAAAFASEPAADLKSALEAALSPADIGSLFFVTVDLDTGETRFADTLEEHNANVALFQAWCQANTGRC